MASLLSWHCQTVPSDLPELVRRAGARYVKVLDPGEQDPFPGVSTVARFYRPDAETNDMIRRGAYGAREWLDWALPLLRARPWVWALEAPNEPQPCNSQGFRRALCEFTVALAELAADAGVRLVGLNLGVGHPDVNAGPDLGPAVDALARGGHLLGLHEYSAPTMQDSATWLCLRCARTAAELRAAGYAVPPIVIGECGIDGGVGRDPKKGWRTFADRAGAGDKVGWYLAQLAWYDRALQETGLPVVAAFVFTAGSNAEWQDFETHEIHARLADYIAGQQAAPVPPPPSPSLRPLGRPVRVTAPMTSSFRDHGARKPPSASPGTDLGVASGTEVLAVADAVVTGRGNAPGTSGRWVQLVAFLPGYGYLTVTYRHLAAYLVRPGQEVRRGDLIAKSGAPHLHIDGQHLGRYVDLAPMMGV